MSAPKRLFSIGLAKPPPEEDLSRFENVDAIKAAIMEGMKGVRELGYEIEVMMINNDDPQAQYADVKAKLETHPDGFMIGFGLRSVPMFTTVFEDMVNMCREVSPNTRMCFATGPDDLLNACKRNFAKI